MISRQDGVCGPISQLCNVLITRDPPQINTYPSVRESCVCLNWSPLVVRSCTVASACHAFTRDRCVSRQAANHMQASSCPPQFGGSSDCPRFDVRTPPLLRPPTYLTSPPLSHHRLPYLPAPSSCFYSSFPPSPVPLTLHRCHLPLSATRYKFGKSNLRQASAPANLST